MKNKKARLWMRTIILAVFVAAVAFTLYEAFNNSPGPVEGDMAKDFELKNLSGQEVQLSDFRGKGVLLNFWGTWCEPCKKEMPYLNAVYQQHMKGVVILGVNINQPKLTVQNFISRYNIKFPILLDSDHDVTTAYDIGKIPSSFLINEHGKIVNIHIGPMLDPSVIKKQLKLIQPAQYK